MIVRQFNPEGMAAFGKFLEDCRDRPELESPGNLLTDDAYTEILSPNMEVEARPLKTKADAAHYLHRVLAPMPETSLEGNAGLWTWLTLFFFDEVCPPKHGKRKVLNDYRYIFEPKNARHFYRHLLFISWHVLRSAKGHNRIFLRSSISHMDSVTTDVMKRLYLTRIPCMFEVLDRLYWDETKNRVKPGIVGSRPARRGDLSNRLPIRIRQLEKTYDLMSLDAEQLISLLGDEFQPILPTPNDQRQMAYSGNGTG